ncbi:MAG: signal peptidase I [Armatimonadetes bacterium]|nr:signal peptidase I [Armatimonadota bacterium]
MTDWQAGLKVQYVVAAIVVLVIGRWILSRHKTSVPSSVVDIVDAALVATVLVFLVIRPFVFQAFYIPSESMYPTLHVHDRILVNKLVYKLRDPQYGDVIVFRSPPGASNGDIEVYLIKRVIGKPRDVIAIKDGTVYRNGTPLQERYVLDESRDYQMEATTVPPHSIWVMGDNRNNSCDSRMWGPLKEKYIIGKAILRFWPPNDFGLIR